MNVFDELLSRDSSGRWTVRAELRSAAPPKVNLLCRCVERGAVLETRDRLCRHRGAKQPPPLC